MKKLIVLAACMAIATAVQARLGETYDQCVARYGKPVSEKVDSSTFRSGVFRIDIYFHDNRAFLIMFSKPGQLMAENILETERSAILEANKAQFSWSEFRCPEPYADQHLLDDMWKRSDGAMACYQHVKNILILVDKRITSIFFDDGKKTTSGL